MSDPAAEVGSAFGRILIPFALLLWGMHKCRNLSYQPGRNRSAFNGLILSLGSWAFLLLENAFSVVLPFMVSLVLMGAVAVIGTSGAVLGIRGMLATGRLGALAQCVAAVIIGLGLPAILGYGLYSGWTKARAASPSNPPTVIPMPAFGFSYRTPGKDWHVIDAAKFNPNVRLALERSAPSMAFAIMADPCDDHATSSDFLPWLRGSLEQHGSLSRFETNPHRVAAHEGTRAFAQVPDRRYVVWLHTTNGRVYALMVSTADTHVSDVDLLAEADRLFEGFVSA